MKGPYLILGLMELDLDLDIYPFLARKYQLCKRLLPHFGKVENEGAFFDSMGPWNWSFYAVK